MMGKEQGFQPSLFYTNFNIDRRVRKDHPLRKIKQLIDFDFIYQEVKGSYGTNGHVSAPPPVILKLMLLLVMYNVRSERELMVTVPGEHRGRCFLIGIIIPGYYFRYCGCCHVQLTCAFSKRYAMFTHQL